MAPSSSPTPRVRFGLAETTNSVQASSRPISVDSVNSVRGYHSISNDPEPTKDSPNIYRSIHTMPATKRQLEHVDRRELYTSLEVRVQYLHSFLDFTADDVDALVIGSKYIKALIPAVVNIVYKKLLSYDITAGAFTTRSTSYQGEVDEYPDEDSPQIRYRKMFLRGYLQKLCSDPSKMEYWEYLDKVGLMHVGLGRKHPLNVDYVHLGATLGVVQDLLFEAILGHPRIKIEQKTAIIKAIGKILWIQNDLLAKWHLKDGEEYLEDDEEIEIEQEGYLHGKKVNNDLVDSDGEPISEGGCPFSGLSKGVEGMNLSEEGKVGSMSPPHGSGIPRPVEKVKEVSRWSD